MATWSTRTTYQGKAVNAGTKAILDAANKMLATKKYGGETSPITLTQGGYNRGGVSASAGTHDGGGAIDITSYNWQNRVKVFRLLGVAMWYRPTIRGLWSAHLHGIVCGDGTASRGAKNQVTEYYNGGDGLVGSARDPNWRPKVFPLFHFYDGKHDVRYAKWGNSVYDQPTTASKNLGKVKKGDAFTPVAIVVVSGSKWFVTADGKFGYDANYTTSKPAAPTPPKPVVKPKVDQFAKDAWWVVTKKTTGLDFPHRDFGKNKYGRDPGFLLHTVGEAKVDGIWWDVSPHGTWYRQSDLARTSAPVDTFAESFEAIRNCSLFEQPYDKSRRDGGLKKGETFLAIGKALDQNGSGRTWYVNADHRWVNGVNVKKVGESPVPSVPEAENVTLRIGTLNVCRNRITTTGKNWTAPSGLRITDVKKGLDWKARAARVDDIQKAMRVSILCTQESGQYVDGDLVSKALGDGWKNILHGDPGDLTNAVHWGSSARKLIKEGSFQFVGAHHNTATWTLMEDIGTGIRFMVSVSHLIDVGQGSDSLRQSQAKAWIAETERIATANGDVPIIFIGDFNSDKDQKVDGPGKAFAATGRYKEAEVFADKRINNEWGTTNQLKDAPASGWRPDRVFVSKDIYVIEIVTVFGAPVTDHNGVGVSLRIPRR